MNPSVSDSYQMGYEAGWQDATQRVWDAFVDRGWSEESISPKELLGVLEAVLAEETAA